MTTTPETDARIRHYGVFYGLDELEREGDVALVVGNCQAESLRLLLDGADLVTLRMPAVHELVASDLPHLDRWLLRADVLVSQPVRAGYHGLPLGSHEMAGRMRGGTRQVAVPVVRFAGLYPAHALIRPPSDDSLVPPLVEYHDLRVLAEAAGLPGATGARVDASAAPAVSAVTAVHAVGDLSLGELRKREVAHGTVVASDLFEKPSFEQMRTLNHPGNSVWTALAARVRDRLDLVEHVVDPGRPLLNSVHAPREAAVVEAWGLDDAPTDEWLVNGVAISTAEVREAHLEWYAAHPDAVAAGLARHEDALRLLGYE